MTKLTQCCEDTVMNEKKKMGQESVCSVSDAVMFLQRYCNYMIPDIVWSLLQTKKHNRSGIKVVENFTVGLGYLGTLHPEFTEFSP